MKRIFKTAVLASFIGFFSGHLLASANTDTFFSLTTTSNSGELFPLSKLKGKKAILVVNTASNCGFTPQYNSLQKLYETYKEEGLEILAFPSNDFGGQEPGNNAEIKDFCESKGVTFPLMAKSPVTGKKINPVFKLLTAQASKAAGSPITVKWNFEKFLIDQNGKLQKHFRSPIDPMSPEFIQHVRLVLGNQSGQ